MKKLCLWAILACFLTGCGEDSDEIPLGRGAMALLRHTPAYQKEFATKITEKWLEECIKTEKDEKFCKCFIGKFFGELNGKEIYNILNNRRSNGFADKFRQATKQCGGKV